MGKTEINKEIGLRNFSSVPIIDRQHSACISNCEVVESKCSTVVSKVVDLLHFAGLGRLVIFKTKIFIIRLFHTFTLKQSGSEFIP